MPERTLPKRLFSYVVASDTGLAPNVTGGVCTLTVCKPAVRQGAVAGQDWIIGLSTAAHGRARVIYAMQADEKIPYADYFADRRFQDKKPRADKRGDNFFVHSNGQYRVAFNDAAHAGKPDKIARDLKSPVAVVGHRFWYFGGAAPPLPERLARAHLALTDTYRRGHRVTQDPALIRAFVKWIEKFPPGIYGSPRDLSSSAAYGAAPCAGGPRAARSWVRPAGHR